MYFYTSHRLPVKNKQNYGQYTIFVCNTPKVNVYQIKLFYKIIVKFIWINKVCNSDISWHEFVENIKFNKVIHLLYFSKIDIVLNRYNIKILFSYKNCTYLYLFTVKNIIIPRYIIFYSYHVIFCLFCKI